MTKELCEVCGVELDEENTYQRDPRICEECALDELLDDDEYYCELCEEMYEDEL